VVPCHRIIGTSGALTGYSGDKVGLKQQLLAVEGIQAMGKRGDSRVARNTLYHYERNEQHEYCLPTCGEHRAPSDRARHLAGVARARRLARPRPLYELPAGSPPARRLALLSPFHAALPAVS
jgi:hypothetical protein